MLQQVCKPFLYYARVVDYTMLHLLNNLALIIKDSTQKVVEGLDHFLNYCAIYPEVVEWLTNTNLV